MYELERFGLWYSNQWYFGSKISFRFRKMSTFEHVGFRHVSLYITCSRTLWSPIALSRKSSYPKALGDRSISMPGSGLEWVKKGYQNILHYFHGSWWLCNIFMGYKILLLYFHGVQNLFWIMKVLSYVFALSVCQNSHIMHWLLLYTMWLKACRILLLFSILPVACTFGNPVFAVYALHLAPTLQSDTCVFILFSYIILPSSWIILHNCDCCYLYIDGGSNNVMPIICLYMTCGSYLAESFSWYLYNARSCYLVGILLLQFYIALGMKIEESFFCCFYIAQWLHVAKPCFCYFYIAWG